MSRVNAPARKGVAITTIIEVASLDEAPALANAIFAATGQRLREMPFSNTVTFA